MDSTRPVGAPSLRAGTAGAPPLASDKERAAKAARDFEATFIAQMMSHIDKPSMGSEGPLGSGKGGEMFRSMLHQKVAERIADRGGIGIAGPVRQALEEAYRKDK